MEVATEVEEANEMKTVMEVPTEWICEENSDFKEISIKVKNEMAYVFGGRNWNTLDNGSSKRNGFCDFKILF